MSKRIFFSFAFFLEFLLIIVLTLSGKDVATATLTNQLQSSQIAWHSQIVDPDGVGSSSLSIDTNGNPRISYSAGNGYYSLKYASWNGGQWEISIVDSMDSGGKTHLVLDQSGTPHIGYSACNPFYCSLKYAFWNGSDWSITMIENSMSGSSLSLALDEEDHPHFSYCTQVDQNLELRHMEWTGSSWLKETVDPTGCWYSTSIAIDKDGYPLISYYFQEDDIKLARWIGQTWALEIVDGSGTVGINNSLALESCGHPRISYSLSEADDLQLASWMGSIWNFQAVDQVGEVGQFSSINLDRDNFPRIAYSDRTHQSILFAHWTGMDWIFEVVASGLGETLEPWMAIDDNDQAHISYSKMEGGTNKGIFYTWRDLITTGKSISGQVYDDYCNPISGVLISYGEGLSVTTDMNGSFRIGNLNADQYTLTPYLEGYSFSPINRSISVDSNIVNQNFIGTSIIPPQPTHLYIPLVSID